MHTTGVGEMPGYTYQEAGRHSFVRGDLRNFARANTSDGIARESVFRWRL